MTSRTRIDHRSLGISAALLAGLLGCGSKQSSGDRGLEPASGAGQSITAIDQASDDMSPATIAEGQKIFRHDTFGDEQFWTDKLKMHEVVAKAVSPKTALSVGLKVDAEAIPPDVAQAIKDGKVNLDSPETTVTLLKLNAVVGLKGTVQSQGGKDTLVALGVTCALCHSTVDDSFAKGIGKRLDGWPNRDLNPGAIIALSPAVTAEQKAVYSSWGPGKYDPRTNLDQKNTPLVLPPIYGLANVKNETYTAEGPMSYWNAYVAITQMGGKGTFTDTRLGIDVRGGSPDMVTGKLAALRSYQHSLATPPPPAGSYDVTAAGRGRAVFDRSCAGCHVGGNGTDNNDGKLHSPDETGMDGAYAARTSTKAYRTTPLRGLWQHPPYFHDGSAKTLTDVVEHYDRVRSLKLGTADKQDLVEYLKSL
ncbi:MAG TPA: c-type cytochrome [Polyangiaceae bacterium]